MKQALEIALYVAARADEYDPPVEPPRYLLAFSKFTKPVKRALSAAFRALEEDDEFRRRVAEDLDVEDVGRPSWLFLHRPDGWDEELRELETQRDERQGEAREAAEEQKAARRLRDVQAEVDRLRAELSDTQQLLARERAARTSASATESALRRELETAERQRDDAVARADSAEAKRATTEATVADLRAELADTKSALERAAMIDIDLVRRTLLEAAESLASATEAVGTARDSLPPEPAVQPRRDRKPASPKRHPLPLPGGLLDDSPEAGAHLVQVPGAVLLVDGYNASQRAWEGVPIAEQRDRLVSALCELHMRTGVDVNVVFDGDGPDLTEAAPTPGQPVRVTFSPAEVEADDVVIERVRALPVTTPVIVASSDNRVREACAAAGANLLTASQLKAVLGR